MTNASLQKCVRDWDSHSIAPTRQSRLGTLPKDYSTDSSYLLYSKPETGTLFCLKMHGKRTESPVAAMSGSNRPIELSHGGVCSRACLLLHVQKRCEGRQALRNVNSSEELLHSKEDEQVVNFVTQMVRDRYRAGRPQGGIFVYRGPPDQSTARENYPDLVM